MQRLLQILFYAALTGSITSTIYCVMVLAAATRFGLRKRRDRLTPATFTPPISVLKPLHGTEPGMERNFESFFEQQYPGSFELLFCARHDTDQGLQLARQVGLRYPHVDAKYVTCGEPMPKFHNAKVYSLEKLDSVAKNDLFITSDADIRVAPDYLLRMVQNLADTRLGLASCVYLGTAYGGDDASFASKLDAVGKSVEMTSGVLVADMIEGTKFALGATMAVRRKSFQDVGGFNELGQFYADDFELGNRLAKQGTGVKMATHIIRLMVQDVPFWLSFRNQLRWMQSTRRSRPWGHLGSGLTFAMPFGLLGLAWGLASGHPLAGVFWLVGMAANRWLQAGAILGVMGDDNWLRNVAIYPLRDFLGSLLWLGSYGGDRFYYRGKIYTLKPGGPRGGTRVMDHAQVLAELQAQEPIFHHPELGTTRADFERMTADDFWEIGASGRIYTRADVIDLLVDRHARPHEDVFKANNFRLQQLAADLYLVSYDLLQDRIRRTRRTTLWRHTPKGWEIVFHQGTIVA